MLKALYSRRIKEDMSANGVRHANMYQQTLVFSQSQLKPSAQRGPLRQPWRLRLSTV